MPSTYDGQFVVRESVSRLYSNVDTINYDLEKKFDGDFMYAIPDGMTEIEAGRDRKVLIGGKRYKKTLNFDEAQVKGLDDGQLQDFYRKRLAEKLGNDTRAEDIILMSDPKMKIKDGRGSAEIHTSIQGTQTMYCTTAMSSEQHLTRPLLEA
jgi:hypothetical protein